MSDNIGTNSGQLLENMDCNARSELHRAVCIEDEESALEKVNSLLASGLNPNRQDRFGQSPVHLAARADSVRVLEALLAAGGCPLLGDLACLSAIDVAARFNSTNALKLFSTLLDSDVQEEDEPLKATLDFWRRGTVLVSVPNGGGTRPCSEASFHSCTSHTRNWVLRTAQYRGSGAIDTSLTCSVCSVETTQPDPHVNSGANIMGRGSMRLEQATDSDDIYAKDEGQNCDTDKHLKALQFSHSKYYPQLDFKFEQAANNGDEQKFQFSVIGDGKEECFLPPLPDANDFKSYNGKQIFFNPASEDIYEYESNVDRDSMGGVSLTKFANEKRLHRTGLGSDENLTLAPTSLSEEIVFSFGDQIEANLFPKPNYNEHELGKTNHNSGFKMWNNQFINELEDNCNNFTVKSLFENSVNTDLNRGHIDGLTTKQNTITPGPETSVLRPIHPVQTDHHLNHPPLVPAPEVSSLSPAECSAWEPSTLIEQNLNMAFLRSDSFISFVNRTKYSNKSSSLFSGYSFYNDADDCCHEEAAKETTEAVYAAVENIMDRKDYLSVKNLENSEMLSYSNRDSKLDVLDIYQKDSIGLKMCEFGVSNKANKDVAFNEDSLKHWDSQKENVCFLTSSSQLNTRKAHGEGLRSTNKTEIHSEGQKVLKRGVGDTTELGMPRAAVETSSEFVIGKPPKYGGKIKPLRKKSFGVLSHKLRPGHLNVKPKRMKQTNDHCNKLSTSVDFFDTGYSVVQGASDAITNADDVNSRSKNEKILPAGKDTLDRASGLNRNILNGVKHVIANYPPVICNSKLNEECSHTEKYKKPAPTPAQIRKFDLAETDSCSSSCKSAQTSIIGKGKKPPRLLAERHVNKKTTSPSPLKWNTNVQSSANKLQSVPTKLLNRGKNPMESGKISTNGHRSPKVTAVGNLKIQSARAPPANSKYCKVDNCSSDTPKSSNKRYCSPKTPMPRTPQVKVKQILGTHLSGENKGCTSSPGASKQSVLCGVLKSNKETETKGTSTKKEKCPSSPAVSKEAEPCRTLKSTKDTKVKVAFTTPKRLPASIVVTQPTPSNRQKGIKEDICESVETFKTPNASPSSKTKCQKKRVTSKECVGEAAMGDVEGVDNVAPKHIELVDGDMESIARCVHKTAEVVPPNDSDSQGKRLPESSENEIPCGLSSVVYNLVCKFNAINGVDGNKGSTNANQTDVQLHDPVDKVHNTAERISVPVQKLFVCNHVSPPQPNNPNLNKLVIAENITEIDSNNNLTSKKPVSRHNSITETATNKRKHLTDAHTEFKVRYNPTSDKLLINRNTCCDTEPPVHETCSNRPVRRAGDPPPLPATGASQSLLNTKQALASDANPPSALVHSTGPATVVPVIQHTCSVLPVPADVRRPCLTTAGSTVGGSSVGSALTIVEEFVYTDSELGVTLIERRCSSLASVSGTLRSLTSNGGREQTKISDRFNDSAGNAGSVLSSLSESILRLPAGTLTQELAAAGSALTGPVTETTARTYARLLHNIRQGKMLAPQPQQSDGAAQYSRELRQALHDPDRVPWNSYRSLEQRMSSVFTSPRPLDYWRGGTAKVCFNYLLLDPAITQDLPLRAASLSPSELFRVFVSAVFYVGKGCKARPYAHLYQALQEQDKGREALDERPVAKSSSAAPGPSTSSAEKVSRILRVWEAGGGVVSLHVFQHTIPAEAWTREAAMIDAIGLGHLSNCVRGSYYGPARGFPNCDRRALGVVLLHRAMLMLLCEGERQLRPPDLPPNPWANRTKNTKHTKNPNLSP